MNTRLKAGIAVLAAIGAISTARSLASAAFAQATPPPPPPPAQGGFPGGQGFPPRRQPPPNNITAKVTVDQAIKTANGKVSGYVNSAVLRQMPGQKGIWVIHIVTTPADSSGNIGKGENVAVDSATNTIVEMPRGPGRGGPPPPPPGGFGGAPPPPPGGGNDGVGY